MKYFFRQYTCYSKINPASSQDLSKGEGNSGKYPCGKLRRRRPRKRQRKGEGQRERQREGERGCMQWPFLLWYSVVSSNTSNWGAAIWKSPRELQCSGFLWVTESWWLCYQRRKRNIGHIQQNERKTVFFSSVLICADKAYINMFCRLDGRNASLHLLSSLHQPPQNPTYHHHRLIKKVRHPKSSKPALLHLRRHLTLWTSEFKLSVCLHGRNDKWRVCVYTLFVCVAVGLAGYCLRCISRSDLQSCQSFAPKRFCLLPLCKVWPLHPAPSWGAIGARGRTQQV